MFLILPFTPKYQWGYVPIQIHMLLKLVYMPLMPRFS